MAIAVTFDEPVVISSNLVYCVPNAVYPLYSLLIYNITCTFAFLHCFDGHYLLLGLGYDCGEGWQLLGLVTED